MPRFSTPYTFLKAACVALTFAASANAQTPKEKSQAKPAATPTGPELKNKASYAAGLNIGQNLKAQGVDIDPEEMAKGIRDGLSGAKPKMTPEEMQQVLAAFQKELAAKRMETVKSESVKNLKDGQAFLAANATKTGVKTLPSGLQYIVIKQGTGPKPTKASTVKTHYRGTLIDGQEFDSSYKRGEPAEFPVGGVIAGWTEALQLMPVGSKYQLFIPAALAYGENAPQGSIIPANGTLVFEVELLEILK
ncbi:unannotated protein [freshwater metagenome]|uniref:peptidylprolyl isomerase n=1 Tax=freshwater metagenome TaxID=449393 RepID=A0A6J6Z780_9ZZZZ|nr:hypothetical protein [Actinomycetota bacterium]RLT15728.1 MAG: FKBP-type peptidyl-prolyl cis-trans isomerase [Planctomycetota bacterium]